MPNIVVTSTANLIKVEFNDLATDPSINTEVIRYSRKSISQVQKEPGATFIHVILSGNVSRAEWNISHDGNSNTLPIDSIDGVTPTDVDHLFTLISDLML